MKPHLPPNDLAAEIDTMPEHVRQWIVAAIPDDLRSYEAFITGRVAAILVGSYGEKSVVRVTESVASELEGTISGYRRLAEVATDRESGVALAFS